MSGSARRVLLGLALGLALLPLAVKKPGLPLQPRHEEPTWYLMASSLARDGDLVCGPEDLRRLFAAWPFAANPALELAGTNAGDNPLVYARPVLYPLLAAPWTVLFEANGPLALNLLLLCAAIAAGAVWLTGPNDDGAGWLFAAGFFLVAAPFAWAFVIAPEVLTLAAVTCGLVLAWQPEQAGALPSARRTAGAGVLLAAAIYQQPWVAPLALAPVVLWLAERKLRPALAALGGALATFAVVGGLALWLTGALHPALALEARVVRLADPLGRPPLPELFQTAPASTAEPDTARLGDFLWGRHMGVLPYFPWLLPAVAFFVLDSRRCRRRLVLAAALALAVALVWLSAPLARQAGGDVVGNRLLVGFYPAFLLLAGTLRPTRAVAATTLAAYAVAVLLLGSLLFAPFGAPVADSTFQAHTRNPPLASLPLELALLPSLPDYQAVELGEGWRVWSRRDQVQTRGAELTVLGGDQTEIWLDTPVEIGSLLLLDVESKAAPNTVTLDFAGVPATVEIAAEIAGKATAAKAERLELSAARPTTRRRLEGARRSFYRLEVRTERGARVGWSNPERIGRGSAIGAQLLFLGPKEWLERDVFHAEWLGCGAPHTVRAGEEFLALARLRNTSAFPWPTAGAAWVRLSYHWLDSAGAEASYNGARTELAGSVAAGATLEAWQKVVAPAVPGDYQLELDPVFERVAWFSTRGVATCRQQVEVLPAELPTGTVSPTSTGR